MEVMRTPDSCFENLPDYNFAPHYTTITAIDGTALRFHFVDEGPRDAAPIVLMHGNPSWSYLHRHMITGLVALGHRVLSLDLMGLGRSDKPNEASYYTLASHVDWVTKWFEAENLTDITLYMQDWGGLIGLNVLPHIADRVSRVIASNTGLPVGEGANKAMRDWLEFSSSVPELPVGSLVNGGSTRTLSAAEIAAYNAPYPDGSYQTSPKIFPSLIPVQPENPGVPQNRETWKFLETWTKPFLTAFGSEDPIAFKPGAHLRFQTQVPGAAGLTHHVIEGANHFIQEDAPAELVTIIHNFAK
jgi:haloalkane dehalogenase